MSKSFAKVADGLLSLFAPKVEASAVTCWHSGWPACWQCHSKCGYNAPCAGYSCSDGSYSLSCSC